MMKKILVILCLMVGLISIHNVKAFDIELTERTSRYISSCDDGGKHMMKPIATCTIHDSQGKVIVHWGTASQCTKCSAMMFSQYYPKGRGYTGVFKYTKATYAGAGHYMVYGYDGFCKNMAEDDFMKGFEWCS